MSQAVPAAETVDVERLDRMPYLKVLTYPKPNLRVAKSRIRQLKELGVERVTFEGHPKIGRVSLTGIGTVGLVVKGAGKDGEVRALKIRRTDANRESMSEEVRLTRLANRVGIGPTVYGMTKDVISMRFIQGVELEDYVEALSGRGTARKLREVIHALLNQCRKLDLVGLDHGELSNLRKHVLIEGDRPYIIDFESASQRRAAKNVTGAAQFLFIGSSLSPRIKRLLGIKDSGHILEALRRYKKEMSDENYVRLLATFGVVI